MSNGASSIPSHAVALAGDGAEAASPKKAAVAAGTGAASGAEGSLDAAPHGVALEIFALRLEADTEAWLRAVGIGEGDRVTVLRRAVFGGPLHVRTNAGGEFALHLSLARAVMVRPIGSADGRRPYRR